VLRSAWSVHEAGQRATHNRQCFTLPTKHCIFSHRHRPSGLHLLIRPIRIHAHIVYGSYCASVQTLAACKAASAHLLNSQNKVAHLTSERASAFISDVKPSLVGRKRSGNALRQVALVQIDVSCLKTGSLCATFGRYADTSTDAVDTVRWQLIGICVSKTNT